MNIFILDLDIEKCVRYHCDQHVVKMILESVQIACTALNKRGFVTPYRSTHIKHPCVIWAGTSYDNLVWLKKFTYALNDEFKYRYGKSVDHSSISVLKQIDGLEFEAIGMTEFPQAMPDEYKVAGDPVQAYRNFYIGEKLKFAKWTRRRKPYWLK